MSTIYNYPAKFRHRTKVYIKTGYYRGHTGRVVDVRMLDEKLVYTVRIGFFGWNYIHCYEDQLSRLLNDKEP